MKILTVIISFFKSKKGQGMLEYVLILTGIAVVVALVIPGLATALTGTFGEIEGSF